MICESCSAKVTDTDVILAVGRWSKLKHFNRVCKYALERGKPCCNHVRILDPELTWEYQDQQTQKEMQNNWDHLKEDYGI
jgi:hypothetical protein